MNVSAERTLSISIVVVMMNSLGKQWLHVIKSCLQSGACSMGWRCQTQRSPSVPGAQNKLPPTPWISDKCGSKRGFPNWHLYRYLQKGHGCEVGGATCWNAIQGGRMSGIHNNKLEKSYCGSDWPEHCLDTFTCSPQEKFTWWEFPDQNTLQSKGI